MSLNLAAYNPRLVWRNADRRAQILLGLLVVVLYADILFAGRGFFLLDLTSYHIPMKWVVRDEQSWGTSHHQGHIESARTGAR